MSIKIDPTTLIDNKFLGIPYKLGGRDLDGADCVGMAIMWFEQFDIKYDYDDGMGPVMAHWWVNAPRRFLDAFMQLGSIVKFQYLKKFDCLLLFGDEQATFPSCLAVMIDDRHFLLSTPERGSFVHILDVYWKNKMFSAIRLNEIIKKFGA